ncbi:hypothetical protein DET49_10375 [Salegentibacter sp. 24]|uniref:BfmA/BtgA family mobilization protein n=1 Tax=Salegentibacter sp. 24 TaxID=2183986 RepID=UPI00105B96E9|nr:BfmA/BtgA family mobilization protein [Salegentibacter sp. 24]TDN95009.1 hypothetical protein DET49_10375 [Salegentibacter sp. 24]
MESFTSIKIKGETAKRFQKFSQLHFKSHSEAISAMLDFFRYNEISPHERLGPTGRTIQQSLEKRINSLIAIIREMEKTQTKPTLAMMQCLFEVETLENKPLILEKKTTKEEKEIGLREKSNVSQDL